MGTTFRPGRVAATKIFGPTPPKRRLVKGTKEESGADSLLTAEAGAWLKGLREGKNLSQSQLCKAVDQATVLSIAEVSKVENGRARMRPQHFSGWATALGMEPRDLVKQLLRYYSPVTYDLLLRDEDDGGDRSGLKG